MQSVQTRKVVDVDRGLFLVRYVSAEDDLLPPTVRITPEASFNDDIRFVLHPDEDDAVLRHPGTCLVMLADAQGRLAIDIAPARSRGSVAAKVTIEALNAESQAVALRPAPQGRRALKIDDFELVGHVAGRGDVAVRASHWLGGPTAPSRIEGFRLEWPGKPNDMDVRYAVTTARPSATSRQPANLGTYVGSRGKALPVVSLALEMTGEGAASRRFTAEMIFLGAPIMRVSGQRISGSGPTGREPLVGLRLSIEDEMDRRQTPTAVPALAASSPRQMRIYRAGEQKILRKV